MGQQRLNVFVKAGQIWDALLQSTITIRVQASFDPLPCAPTSGVLGGAGPNVVDADIRAHLETYRELKRKHIQELEAL